MIQLCVFSEPGRLIRPVLRILPALLLGATLAAHGADEAPAESKETPKADGAEAPAPKPEPPKKTEYDQLPLRGLLAKANANDLTAQFELASRFNYGRGLPKDTDQAMRWLRRAARAGQLDAARMLAVKLYNGYDTSADFVEALYWARILANKGDQPAQLMLANMYGNGEGTPRDLVQAYMWYSIAAVSKRDGAKEEPREDLVQAALQQRDKLASLLTREEEAQAQKLASAWWLNKYAPKRAAKPGPKGKSKKAAPMKKGKTV